MSSKLRIVLTFLMSVATFAAANGTESFESDDVPEGWKADANSSIAVSTDTFRSGKRSLQWKWRRKASVLSFAKAGQFPGEFTAKGSGESFVLWVYNPTPVKDKLLFEIGKEGRTDREFCFNLNYRGWRVLCFCYPAEDLIPKNDSDVLRIISPASLGTGILYFDLYRPAGVTNVTVQPCVEVSGLRSL